MKTVVLATNNRGKIEELKRMLGEDFNVVSQKEIGYNIDVEETGTTFNQNALIKAQELYSFAKEKVGQDVIVIADDSGLLVDALPNELGVFTARFSGDTNKATKDKSNNDLLLKKMEGITNRDARYKTVICVIDCYDIKFFEGVMELEVGDKYVAGNGFAFDFICKAKGYNKYVSELMDTEKDSISHRGEAIQKVMTYLGVDKDLIFSREELLNILSKYISYEDKIDDNNFIGCLDPDDVYTETWSSSYIGVDETGALMVWNKEEDIGGVCWKEETFDKYMNYYYSDTKEDFKNNLYLDTYTPHQLEGIPTNMTFYGILEDKPVKWEYKIVGNKGEWVNTILN